MIYTSESEVIALVDAFHKRALSPTKWNHAAQLTVTLYYGLKFPYAIAFDLLKDGMKWVTLNPAPDTEKQNDTTIHFWLQTVKSFAIKYRNIDDLSALANILIATYKESEVPYNFYNQETVFDTPTYCSTANATDPATIEMPVPARILTAAA